MGGGNGETSHVIHRVVFVLWLPIHLRRAVTKALPQSECYPNAAAPESIRDFINALSGCFA